MPTRACGGGKRDTGPPPAFDGDSARRHAGDPGSRVDAPGGSRAGMAPCCLCRRRVGRIACPAPAEVEDDPDQPCASPAPVRPRAGGIRAAAARSAASRPLAAPQGPAPQRAYGSPARPPRGPVRAPRWRSLWRFARMIAGAALQHPPDRHRADADFPGETACPEHPGLGAIRSADARGRCCTMPSRRCALFFTPPSKARRRNDGYWTGFRAAGSPHRPTDPASRLPT